jgi:integrase
MTSVSVAGIKRFRHKRTGIWYSYHRASNTRIEPPHPFGSPGFFIALDQVTKKHQAKRAIKPTWGSVVSNYRESSNWSELADRTRRDYSLILDWLAGYDDVAMSEFTTPRVNKIKEKAFKDRGRRWANYCVALLSIVFNYAIQQGDAETNPAARIKKIKKPKSEAEANVPWTEPEIAAFMQHAPAHLNPPFAVAMYLGMRGGDVIRIPKTAYRNGVLTIKAGKNALLMPYPVPDDLKRLLDGMEAHTASTLFVSSKGAPWKENGFRRAVFNVRDRLAEQGLLRKELTIHGLRTTVGQLAAEIGYSDDQIADGLGQKDTKATKVYVRDAARTKNLKRVIEDVTARRRTIVLSTNLSTSEVEDIEGTL